MFTTIMSPYEDRKRTPPDEEVLAQFRACRAGGVNLLLDAPLDNHGVIPRTTVDAFMRLRRGAGI